MRVGLATANEKKRAEVEAILAEFDLELVPMTELGVESPVEDGDTFEANALIKARAVAQATGLPAIADDSGLEVDALEGAPGVRSARYAGEHATDEENNAKLLAALAEHSEEAWTARFVCAVALVTPDGDERVVHGHMEGRIIEEPRGSNGFGYDPLFVSAGERRTNAELPSEVKNAHSHRGAALRALRPHVAELLRR